MLQFAPDRRITLDQAIVRALAPERVAPLCERSPLMYNTIFRGKGHPFLAGIRGLNRGSEPVCNPEQLAELEALDAATERAEILDSGPQAGRQHLKGELLLEILRSI